MPLRFRVSSAWPLAELPKENAASEGPHVKTAQCRVIQPVDERLLRVLQQSYCWISWITTNEDDRTDPQPLREKGLGIRGRADSEANRRGAVMGPVDVCHDPGRRYVNPHQVRSLWHSEHQQREQGRCAE